MTITCDVPSGVVTPIKFYSNAGRITASGTLATLDTTGAIPGTIVIAADARGSSGEQLSATTIVEVSLPGGPLPTPTPVPTIPAFPWPPPTPSAEILLPDTPFLHAATFGEISEILGEAMDHTGYAERSYYTVPGGIAIVTRIERMQPDGHSATVNRWALNPSGMTKFSLSSYLRLLFTAPQGYYRVLVFIVSSQPFSTQQQPVNSETAQQWLQGGLNDLPSETRSLPKLLSTRCTVLIYEFKRVNNQAPASLVPGRLGADVHLRLSGLWSALSIP